MKWRNFAMDISQKQLIDGKMVGVIATYRDDDSNLDYIIYTDESKDENGKLNVTYGRYKLVDGKIEVSALETHDEEVKILEVLKYVTKETQKNGSN